MSWSSLWEQRLGSPTGWSQWRKTPEQERRFQAYLDRAGGNLQRAGMLWVRENPTQYLKLCVIRLRTELGPYTANTSAARRIIGLTIWLLIFPVGAYGLWRARNSAFSDFALLAALIIFAVVVFDSLVFVNFRYRLPVELTLAIFAGWTYAGWLQLWSGFRLSERPGSNGDVSSLSGSKSA